MAAPSVTDCTTTYWANFVDPNGAVSLTVLLFAINDREAKHKAKAMVDDQDIDLWDGERLIERFLSN